jgi:Asp/Glu/hydantoin racemase
MEVGDMAHRIANLVGESAKDWGFEVPRWAVSPGFESEVVLVPILNASPLNEIDSALSGLLYADAAIAAVEDGCDAVFINTVDDCGIQYMRAALQVPVVGAGQAGMQLAAGLGKRFAIVTVFPPELAPMYEGLVHGYGFDAFYAGTWFVTRNDEKLTAGSPEVHEMRSRQGALLERARQVARDAVAAGAEAIVLGCTCMSPARDAIASGLPVPVIDPLVAAHKMAELLVTMGLSHAEAHAPSRQGAALHAMLRGAADLTSGADPVEELCDDACSDIGEAARDARAFDGELAAT